MKYTVLLLYPDHGSTVPYHIYLAHVEAVGPATAQVMAQQEAANCYGTEHYWFEFKALFTTEGHHADLSKES